MTLIILVLLTVFFIGLIIYGTNQENEAAQAFGWIGLVLHLLIGWLVVGCCFNSEEISKTYDADSEEVRLFNYGSDVFIYVFDEGEESEVLIKTFKCYNIFIKGDWALEVTREYNVSGFENRVVYGFYDKEEIISNTRKEN